MPDGIVIVATIEVIVGIVLMGVGGLLLIAKLGRWF